jgi:hypothetical protein
MESTPQVIVQAHHLLRSFGNIMCRPSTSSAASWARPRAAAKSQTFVVLVVVSRRSLPVRRTSDADAVLYFPLVFLMTLVY